MAKSSTEFKVPCKATHDNVRCSGTMTFKSNSSKAPGSLPYIGQCNSCHSWTERFEKVRS